MEVGEQSFYLYCISASLLFQLVRDRPFIFKSRHHLPGRLLFSLNERAKNML